MLQCFDAVGWGGQEGHPACKKTEWWGAGMVIYLERGADLHMDRLMPLPLTVSCFSKIQIGFTFLVPAHPGSPGQWAVKRVCVCVCNFTKQKLPLPLAELVAHLIYGSLNPPESISKQHLSFWFSRFSTAHSCNQQTHRPHYICGNMTYLTRQHAA